MIECSKQLECVYEYCNMHKISLVIVSALRLLNGLPAETVWADWYHLLKTTFSLTPFSSLGLSPCESLSTNSDFTEIYLPEAHWFYVDVLPFALPKNHELYHFIFNEKSLPKANISIFGIRKYSEMRYISVNLEITPPTFIQDILINSSWDHLQ